MIDAADSFKEYTQGRERDRLRYHGEGMQNLWIQYCISGYDLISNNDNPSPQQSSRTHRARSKVGLSIPIATHKTRP